MKSSEGNSRAMYRGQNKLIGKFKMVAADVISIREYTYISTGIKREFGEIWYELQMDGISCRKKFYFNM